MPKRSSAAAATAVGVCWLVAGGLPAALHAEEERTMSKRAKGEFSVEMTPDRPDEEAGGVTFGRLILEKEYRGDLEGPARGEMLTAMTPVEGSAGYVAIERVEGRLGGRRGSFVLQHSGIMGRGEQSLTLTIVPDSGAGELEGLLGEMTIEIGPGGHSYELIYTLPTDE